MAPLAAALVRRYDRAKREGQGARGAFDAEVRAFGLEPEHGFTTERAEPTAEIAEWFGLPAGEANRQVRRRRLPAGGIPVRLNAGWFPLDIAGGTVLEEPAPVIVGSGESALAGLGHPRRAEWVVPSGLPTGTEATALEISPVRTSRS